MKRLDLILNIRELEVDKLLLWKDLLNGKNGRNKRRKLKKSKGFFSYIYFKGKEKTKTMWQKL